MFIGTKITFSARFFSIFLQNIKIFAIQTRFCTEIVIQFLISYITSLLGASNWCVSERITENNVFTSCNCYLII